MSNPHRISIFLILLLFLGLIFVAVSDLLSFHEDDFDLSEALVQVQVQTPRHYDSSDVEEPVNYLLASKRRIHSCDPFTADEATVYYVPSECFDASIDRAQNKVSTASFPSPSRMETALPSKRPPSCPTFSRRLPRWSTRCLTSASSTFPANTSFS